VSTYRRYENFVHRTKRPYRYGYNSAWSFKLCFSQR